VKPCGRSPPVTTSALFDQNMRTQVPPQKLRDVWQRTAANGSLVRTGEPVRSELPDGAELYDYPLQYEKRRAHLQVVIRAGQVAGLFERLGEPSGRWKRSRGMWRQVFRPSPA
jgi:hypothetical protein